jgi:hypothetical protein
MDSLPTDCQALMFVNISTGSRADVAAMWELESVAALPLVMTKAGSSLTALSSDQINRIGFSHFRFGAWIG